MFLLFSALGKCVEPPRPRPERVLEKSRAKVTPDSHKNV
jgi:hypothetical protein